MFGSLEFGIWILFGICYLMVGILNLKRPGSNFQIFIFTRTPR
ncbi:hypothetical protein D1AOALGA4SA_1314 [Olavius algarvensis Delta 1 endosymbiont]|nr:hypothetical protein D1AOALGA4SA_1314 [Olavius algarvensis Delta 1 endosymbiont]